MLEHDSDHYVLHQSTQYHAANVDQIESLFRKRQGLESDMEPYIIHPTLFSFTTTRTKSRFVECSE